MEYKDYYQTMGLDRDANQDEIKRAYRKLARKFHPDVSKEPDAETRFKEIGEAYEVLKDPEKRAAYDQLGANWQAGQDFTPPPNWDANFEFSGGGFTGGDASAFSDFFENLFGHAHTNWSAHQTTAQDHHARILIKLEDAFHGANRLLTLQRPQINTQGQLINTPHTLNVKIPKGIRQGQQIRLREQGGQNPNGQHGDLYLEVVFEPHKLYRLHQADLEFDLPVAPWEAALGAKVTVPTPAGNVDLNIPANSKTGTKLRLKGRGLPGKTVADSGDLYAVIKIVLPPADSEQAKALYQQMQQQMPFNPRAGLGV